MPYINAYFHAAARYHFGAVDITSAVQVDFFTIALQSLNSGQSVRWTPDGTRFAFCNFADKLIHEFICVIPWMVSTAQYYGYTDVAVAHYGTSLSGFCFADDGLKMYCVGVTPAIGLITQFDLTAPYDVTTATFAHSRRADDFVSVGQTDIHDIHVSNDGTEMLIMYTGAAAILYRCEMSTPHDISTAVDTQDFALWNSFSEEVRDMHVSDDGRQIFIIADGELVIFQFDLLTAYDLSTISMTQCLDISTPHVNPRGVFIGDGGARLYTLDNSTELVYQWDITGPDVGVQPWELNIASTTYDSKSYLFTEGTQPHAFFFKPDGLKLYICDFVTREVFQYTLSTAWEVDTAVYDSVLLDMSASVTTCTGLFINPDGDKLFAIDSTNDLIVEFELSTPWLISSGAATGATLSVNINAFTLPRAVTIHPYGYWGIVAESGTRQIYHFWMEVAWDLSTAHFITHADYYFDTNLEDTSPRGIFFNPKGSQAFVSGDAGNTIIKYSVPALYRSDVFTSPVEFSVAGQTTSPRNIYIKPDGTKLYVIDSVAATIYQYTTVTT